MFLHKAIIGTFYYLLAFLQIFIGFKHFVILLKDGVLFKAKIASKGYKKLTKKERKYIKNRKGEVPQ